MNERDADTIRVLEAMKGIDHDRLHYLRAMIDAMGSAIVRLRHENPALTVRVLRELVQATQQWDLAKQEESDRCGQ